MSSCPSGMGMLRVNGKTEAFTSLPPKSAPAGASSLPPPESSCSTATPGVMVTDVSSRMSVMLQSAPNWFKPQRQKRSSLPLMSPSSPPSTAAVAVDMQRFEHFAPKKPSSRTSRAVPLTSFVSVGRPIGVALRRAVEAPCPLSGFCRRLHFKRKCDDTVYVLGPRQNQLKLAKIFIPSPCPWRSATQDEHVQEMLDVSSCVCAREGGKGGGG